MVGFLGPTARFNNKTEDVMDLLTEDVLGGRLGVKRIESGGFVDLGYRKGIDRIGPQIHFWVLPENREDVVRAAPNPILPIQVFQFADIDISYELPDGSVTGNYQVGAVLHFQFREGTIIRRIGLVRCFTALYHSVATAFGSGCFAAHDVPNIPGQAPAPAPVLSTSPNQGEALGQASAPIQAPPAPASAPVPSTSLNLGEDPLSLALYPIEVAPAPAPAPASHDIPCAAQVAAPPPPSEIQLVIN